MKFLPRDLNMFCAGVCFGAGLLTLFMGLFLAPIVCGLTMMLNLMGWRYVTHQ